MDMIPVKVNNETYEVLWHEVPKGSVIVQRLYVFQNQKLLGSKDFPFSVDQGMGIIEYSVKSIVNQKQQKCS